jgi:DNA-binding transcriptional LysR family regulator
MNIDWDDVRYLLAIQRSSTLERAARTLRTNATTVGRRLTQLEERLGARLFDRTSRGFVMTETARRVLPHAEQMERDAFALARLASSGDLRLSGVVHLTTTEAIATRFLMPHLPRLRERHPGLDLVVSCSERRLDLAKREADVALRLRRPDEPDVVARRLFRIELALYASPAYLARRGRPDDGATPWSEHDLVAFVEGRASRPENEWMARACPGARVVLRSNSVAALLDATAVGLGVGLLPRIAAEREPALVLLDTPEPPTSRHVWLTYHRDLEPNPRTRAVIDFLTETLSSPPRRGLDRVGDSEE